MGTRKAITPKSLARLDHPHAYGDKNKFMSKWISYVGSSPRVWGQEYLAEPNRLFARIIPTRMGTSATMLNLGSE